MNYQVITPPPPLQKYVQYFWSLEYSNDDRAEKTFTVMSTGAPGLVFQQCPQIFTGFEGERLPQLFVFGQATKYGQLHGCGSFHTIGINFHPTAIKSVFGLDASELTDENICITHLTSASLAEQLLHCTSIRQQASYLFAFVAQQIKRHKQEQKQINHAVAALQQGKSLSGVQDDLNISERSLERLFLQHTGITPVLFSRICRFQSALVLMRQPKYRSLTDVAHSLGYFDQSHFIRDFKQFSGVTPGIYLRNAIERMPGFPEWE